MVRIQWLSAKLSRLYLVQEIWLLNSWVLFFQKLQMWMVSGRADSVRQLDVEPRSASVGLHLPQAHQTHSHRPQPVEGQERRWVTRMRLRCDVDPDTTLQLVEFLLIFSCPHISSIFTARARESVNRCWNWTAAVADVTWRQSWRVVIKIKRCFRRYIWQDKRPVAIMFSCRIWT